MTLANVVTALERYGRYEAAHVFVDDVEEFRRESAPGWHLEPATALATRDVGGQRLSCELFPDQGIACFRLAEPLAKRDERSLTLFLDHAQRAAAKAKGNGLLGNLELAMLTRSEGDRIFLLYFDDATTEWVAYDGPLVRWAKTALTTT